jgi:uncharacterized protein (TIGR02594 family)
VRLARFYRAGYEKQSPMKYFLAAMGGAAAIMLLLYFADQGVLATAATYADDEPRLIKFMSDMGYPKNGDWCGEFAASIIMKAGGTPPSSAAIASSWRRYGTPDATPRVGDVAVADRGVATGSIGSHVGFVTAVDPETDTFTLESGNASNVYTTRKISCYSFHTPPDTVVSALTGNGFRPAIAAALAGRAFSHAIAGPHPVVPAVSWASPNDCRQRGADDFDEALNDDSLQQGKVSASYRDFGRACGLDLPPSDALRFCPNARITRSTMHRPYGRCAEATTNGEQCLASRKSAPACFI